MSRECLSCGASNANSIAVCGNCGATLHAALSEPQTPVNERDSREERWSRVLEGSSSPSRTTSGEAQTSVNREGKKFSLLYVGALLAMLMILTWAIINEYASNKLENAETLIEMADATDLQTLGLRFLEVGLIALGIVAIGLVRNLKKAEGVG